jgi:hypothetical protein
MAERKAEIKQMLPNSLPTFYHIFFTFFTINGWCQHVFQPSIYSGCSALPRQSLAEEADPDAAGSQGIGFGSFQKDGIHGLKCWIAKK